MSRNHLANISARERSGEDGSRQPDRRMRAMRSHTTFLISDITSCAIPAENWNRFVLNLFCCCTCVICYLCCYQPIFQVSFILSESSSQVADVSIASAGFKISHDRLQKSFSQRSKVYITLVQFPRVAKKFTIPTLHHPFQAIF